MKKRRRKKAKAKKKMIAKKIATEKTRISGDQLRDRLDKLHMSQRKFAIEILQVNPVTVNRWVRSKRPIPPYVDRILTDEEQRAAA